MNDPKRPDSDDIADADWLFQDEPPKSASPGSSRIEIPKPDPDGTIPLPEEVYELLKGGGADSADHPLKAAEPPPAPRPKSAGASSVDRSPAPESPVPRRSAKVRDAERPEAYVDQVWSRSAEWGPSLIRLGIVAAICGFVIVSAISAGQIGFAFFLIAVGGAVCIALCYPIAITLERPIRMTPEHAVKDYYEALSHHLPHYRRMWLLLSTPARTGSKFGSYDGFRAYWNRRLSALRGSAVSKTTPLQFETEDVIAEKSAGKDAAEVAFDLVVFARGRRSDGPLARYPMRVWAVKGPDNMWYLDSAAIPD